MFIHVGMMSMCYYLLPVDASSFSGGIGDFLAALHKTYAVQLKS